MLKRTGKGTYDGDYDTLVFGYADGGSCAGTAVGRRRAISCGARVWARVDCHCCYGWASCGLLAVDGGRAGGDGEGCAAEACECQEGLMGRRLDLLRVVGRWRWLYLSKLHCVAIAGCQERAMDGLLKTGVVRRRV